MAQNEVTDHEHGTMDIREHQKMFGAFVRFSTWVCVLAIAVLIFLALTNV
ncbi:aa3-type cytochrome c oxidase subunit IV [Paracoccus sediminicola]|nr:aa3-type cytochrome c oxidase subunit IV [Paracoccus sediminicola]WBU56764.1 aa3-type cytochrome c oxidase subunit IV [Paracoccus sediminicola]